MEEKKGNDLKVFFLVFILVILAAVAAYFRLYMPLVEKKVELEDQQFELEFHKITLRNLTVNEDIYIRGINDSSEKITEVLNNYSAGNTPEKSIMMVNSMEREVGIKLPNIGFSQPNLVTTVKMPMASLTENGEYTIAYYDVSLLQESLSMNYSCTYEQLKKLIDFVNAYPERMNIESMSMTYDSETGGLKGDVSLNLYAVTGTGKEYAAPEISGLSLGETNIFQ